jgi:hypothetical protein
MMTKRFRALARFGTESHAGRRRMVYTPEQFELLRQIPTVPASISIVCASFVIFSIAFFEPVRPLLASAL